MSINIAATPAVLLPPVTSIADLPTEIKTLIVNYAKLQDESYMSRFYSQNADEAELVEGVLKANRWRGKSLNALFLVDTEWSNLAAIHLFKVS